MATSAAQDTYQEVHRDAIVIDAACGITRRESTIDDCIKGGLTVVAPTVGRGGSSCIETLRQIAMWNERLTRRADELFLITGVEDMERAKNEGKLGILFHFQGSSPIEKDLGLVEIFYKLGVRVMQLTYNVKDFVGDGCEETGDGGLSDFGRRLIGEMNRVGMLIDLSHTGHRTAMEAMEASESPCVISHSGCHAVYRSNRNVPDDQIKAVAAGGGVMGVTAFPPCVSSDTQSTMDQLMDHFDHVAGLIGANNIGFGVTTLPSGAVWYPRTCQGGLPELHRLRPLEAETYPPPPYIFPQGIENPRQIGEPHSRPAGTEYSKTEVHGILGRNFMRVYQGSLEVNNQLARAASKVNN